MVTMITEFITRIRDEFRIFETFNNIFVKHICIYKALDFTYLNRASFVIVKNVDPPLFDWSSRFIHSGNSKSYFRHTMFVVVCT